MTKNGALMPDGLPSFLKRKLVMSRLASKPTKKPAKPLAAMKPAAKRSPPVKAPIFTARSRVTHRTFGPGVVQSVEGDILEIKFAKVGVKRVVKIYVSRA